MHRSEALVAEELRALRSNLDYQLLPAYRQELEREMVVHSEGASEASPWATQACVAIRFLHRVLEEERGCHAELSRHVADLHRQVSVLGHKCATLQVMVGGNMERVGERLRGGVRVSRSGAWVRGFGFGL